MPHSIAVTDLLRCWIGGDEKNADRLAERVYPDLRRMAQKRLSAEPDCNSVEATGLAHEVWMRLERQQRTRWRGRDHFFAIAARVMRRVLIDRHRARSAEKRAATRHAVALDDDVVAAPDSDETGPWCQALRAALQRLAEQDPRQAQIVTLRFCEGASIEDTAQAFSISPSTVKRETAIARAWLRREVMLATGRSE